MLRFPLLLLLFDNSIVHFKAVAKVFFAYTKDVTMALINKWKLLLCLLQFLKSLVLR